MANFERLVLGGGGGGGRPAVSKPIFASKYEIVNARLKALDEIYNIYTLLHRSACNNSAKFLQAFSHFCSIILKILFIFRNSGPKFTNFDDFLRNISNIYGKYQHILYACSNVLGFRS